MNLEANILIKKQWTLSPIVLRTPGSRVTFGGLRGQSLLGEGVESNAVRTRGMLPPFKIDYFYILRVKF